MKLIANLLVLVGVVLAIASMVQATPATAQMKGPCVKPSEQPLDIPGGLACAMQNHNGCTPIFGSCSDGGFELIDYGDSGCKNTNEVGCTESSKMRAAQKQAICECDSLFLGNCIFAGIEKRDRKPVKSCSLILPPVPF